MYVPVMLVQNLSDTLVNGLLGTVQGLGDVEKTITVHFQHQTQPSVIHQTHFTVFDPQVGKVCAQRTQFPLKLAFGLTIHKAQGLTLPKVVVHCNGIRHPGQLGVALGRATSVGGLQVCDYKREMGRIPHPPDVAHFYEH